VAVFDAGWRVAPCDHALLSLLDAVSHMRPDRNARPEYLRRFARSSIALHRAGGIDNSSALPVRMYVAGGAALHLYTGERVSGAIDATFSHRIALPENLEVAYRTPDGAARLLYFDRQYNDTLGLLHEDAYEDSWRSRSRASIHCAEVRLLSALDLAVSNSADSPARTRDDIVSLARHKLMNPPWADRDGHRVCKLLPIFAMNSLIR